MRAARPPGSQGALGFSLQSRVYVFSTLGGGALSPLIQGAWAGRLVHFSGLDVLGPTAGAIARLLQDREVELWEGKRIVASLEEDEVRLDCLLSSRA